MGFRNQIIIMMAVGLTLANVGCSRPSGSMPASSEAPEMAKSAPLPLTMVLTPGQVLSVISIDEAPGETARQVRQSYLRDAFGLAGPLGLKPLGTLSVSAAPVGTFAPGAVSFFAWPGAGQAAALADHPQWPAIKARRPLGWDELRVHDVVVADALSLSFRPQKTYTMATAWINPDRPADYDQYLNNIAATVAQIGGRFILDLRAPAFESHAHDGPAPGRVVFVEWDSPEALASLQKTDGFKNNVALLQSGTTAFELLILHNSG